MPLLAIAWIEQQYYRTCITYVIVVRLVEIESANKAHATKLSYKASIRRHVHNSLDIITREEENLVVTIC